MTKARPKFIKIFSLAIAGLILANVSQARDSFDLDSVKHSVESLTKPTEPYKTRFGNVLSVYSIPPKLESKNRKPMRFLVQGGLHGNELLASEFVGWLAQRINKGESPLNLINGGQVEFDLIPYANPDGTILYARYNGNHINLNRNFGVLWGITKENPGRSAFSEVESRAIRDLLLKRNYTGAVDVHGYINWVVAPTSPDDKIKGLPKASPTQVSQYRKWARTLSQKLEKKLPGYELKTAGELGDGGAFEDFAWWGAGVPAFCLEVFSDKRFVPTNIASKIVDLLTPKALQNTTDKATSRADMFLTYENFIYEMFDEATRLKGDENPSPEIVDIKAIKKNNL